MIDLMGKPTLQEASESIPFLRYADRGCKAACAKRCWFLKIACLSICGRGR